MTLVALGFSLAGCWQGNNAATYVQSTQGATGDGVEKDTDNGLAGVRGAVLVAKDGNFSVVAILVNKSDQDDSLVGVGVADAVVRGNIAIPAGGTVAVGGPGNPIHIFGKGLKVNPSAFVRVVFAFASGESVTTTLLVRSPEGYWAGTPVK